MWLIYHFIFIYFTQPSAWMHFIGAVLLVPLTRFGKPYKSKDVGHGIGLLLMYLGFYIAEELYHFSFLPWWVTAICGFRKKRFYILTGGVLWGVIMHALTWRGRLGSVLMNLGRMMKTDTISIVTRIIIHFLLGLYTLTISIDFKEVDILAGISVAMCAFWCDSMSWFSVAMLFTNPLSPGLSILHFTNFNWYEYFKNNHFRKVKYSASYVYPVLILVALMFREEITNWKSYILKA